MNQSPIAFWCQLWQAQIEQSLKFWSYWAQFTPHEGARDLSVEANALKAAAPAKPARARARIAAAQ